LVNSANLAQTNAIMKLIRDHGAGWWHWFPTAWIINDPTGQDIEAWSNLLRAATPDLVYLVIDLNDPRRYPIGYMKSEWYEWIRDSWHQ
jgi:hypothetical protein